MAERSAASLEATRTRRRFKAGLSTTVFRWTRTLMRFGFAAIVGLLALLVAAVIYDSLRPPVSTLMLARRIEGRPVTRQWVPLSAVSSNLVAAVVMSEDGQFCFNHGVDWESLRSVVENPDGPARGASTITMQVVKNLFLWPGRSYLRKALEIPIALVLDLIWTKKTILQAYLNTAEWGRDTYGAEAAAQTHFGTTARQLTARQAALLATSLPNPIDRDPRRPTRLQRALTGTVLARMQSAEQWLGCLR